MAQEEKSKIEIPFGAKDSELCGWEYTIPEGMEAEIKGGKIIVRKKEIDAKKNYIQGIRKTLASIEDKAHNILGLYDYDWVAIRASHRLLGEYLDCIEKQKEQKPRSTEETELNSIAFLEQLGYTCVPPGKEQKLAENNYPEYNSDEYESFEDGNATGLRRKEQKPTEWKENFCEEVERVSKRYPEVSFAKLSRIAKHFAEWVSNNFAEWSEEDEIIKHDIENLIHFALKDGSAVSPAADTTKENALDWLKSLRPQHHWKPSGEQMEALEKAFRKEGTDEYRHTINSLYQDLKKLM